MGGAAGVIAASIVTGVASKMGGMAIEDVLEDKLDGHFDTRERLRRIERLLEEISLKLDYLLYMVSEIPDLVKDAINTSDLDRRWAYLESDYDNLRDSSTTVTAPDETVRNELRHAWLVVVDYETRPEKLTDIPFWTEYIRSRLKIERGNDSALFEDLSEKISDIEDCIETAKDNINQNFKEAEALFTQKYKGSTETDKANDVNYISSSEVTHELPLIAWKKSKNVKVRKSRGIGRGYKYKTHRKFSRSRDNIDKKLVAIRRELVSDYKEISALIPVFFLLERYQKWLGRISTNVTPDL